MKSRGSAQLIVGWVVVTVILIMVAAIVPALAIGLALAWVVTTVPVGVELGRAAIGRRADRIVTGSTPSAWEITAPGMILLSEADRDPRWTVARSRQEPQHGRRRPGPFHVNRALRPLTDCPAGHYDYHELRESSLYRAVRRCAWCSPPAVWTEDIVTGEDSKR